MKERSGTAPPYRRDDGRRLAAWLALVALLAVIGYSSRAFAGKPSPQVLYEWSTAIGTLLQDGVLLLIVLAIAGFSASVLALRRPRSFWLAAALIVIWFVLVLVGESVYGHLVHVGNEQGLTPKHWEPAHAAAYIGNAVVICLGVPFVEELTFRGLGYSVLERFGRWPAIIGIGIAFGLAHGLLLSFPVLAFFGSVLAWIRARTGSVYPGMVLHGLFNLVALIVAVTL